MANSIRSSASSPAASFSRKAWLRMSIAAAEATSPASAPPTPSATTKIPRAASARNESSFSGRFGFNPRSLTEATEILPAGVGVLIERPPDRIVRGALGQRRIDIIRVSNRNSFRKTEPQTTAGCLSRSDAKDGLRRLKGEFVEPDVGVDTLCHRFALIGEFLHARVLRQSIVIVFLPPRHVW